MFGIVLEGKKTSFSRITQDRFRYLDFSGGEIPLSDYQIQIVLL